MPTNIDIWRVLPIDFETNPRDAEWLTVVTRLREGFTLEQAQAQMDSLAARLREQYQFHENNGMQIELQSITPPKMEYSSLVDVFTHALEQEEQNTRAIYELYELAKEVTDYSPVAALQWFLDEQVEEEKVMTEAMGLVRFAGDDKSALLALNQQFGAQAATAVEE